MAVALRNNASSFDDTAPRTSFTPTMPTHDVGDLLVLIALHGSSTSSGMSISGGTVTWNIIDALFGNTELNGGAWWGIADSASESAPTITTTTDNDISVTVTSFSGAHATTPINDFHINVLTSVAADVTCAVDTTADNCYLFFEALSDTGATETFTWTGSMTEDFDLDLMATHHIMAAAHEQVTTQTNYSRTGTKSGTNRRLTGILLAISPAAASNGIPSKLLEPYPYMQSAARQRANL